MSDLVQVEADSSEIVAETILGAVESGEEEVFPHEWMKKWQVGGGRV